MPSDPSPADSGAAAPSDPDDRIDEQVAALQQYIAVMGDGDPIAQLWLRLCAQDAPRVPAAEEGEGEDSEPLALSSTSPAPTGEGEAAVPPEEEELPAAPVRYRARHDGWTAARRQRFVGTLARTGCVRDACRVAGISSTSAYRHRLRDPGFAREWQAALRDGAKVLEAAAFQRGVEGVDEPIVSGGKVIGTRKKYSDPMLKLMIERGDMRKRQRIGGQPGVITWEEHEQGWRFDWNGEKYKEPSPEEARAEILAKLAEMHARMAEAGECAPDPGAGEEGAGEV